MSLRVQVCFWDPDFNSYGKITKCGSAGSYGRSILNFLMKLYTVSHNDYTKLHFHWPGFLVPVSPPTLVVYIFFFSMIAILTDVKWYLIVGFICIFLMNGNVGYLFIYLLAICMFSLEKHLPGYFAQFLIVCECLWCVWVFICIWIWY